MQRAFGGVAPAPLKDKRFFIFFRKGASFFETISLKVNCRGQTSISRHFPSLLDERSAATLRARSVLLRRGPGSLEILVFSTISATMFHDGFSR